MQNKSTREKESSKETLEKRLNVYRIKETIKQDIQQLRHLNSRSIEKKRERRNNQCIRERAPKTRGKNMVLLEFAMTYM